jgi:hypothetical protein
MLEFLILLPNLTAQFMITLDKAYYSNVIFSVGNLVLIFHNYQIHDVQMYYFMLLEVMSVAGIILHVYRKKKEAKNAIDTKAMVDTKSGVDA